MNYKLLKDLPDVKAGAEVTPFNHVKTTYYNCKVSDNKFYSWSSFTVENNPDWFSPIPSHPTKEEIINALSPYKNVFFSRENIQFALEKHEESIKQQLIEKIEGVSDTLFGKRGNTEYVAAKSPSELKSEISSLIRNFKSE